MVEVKVFDISGKSVGSLTLKGEVFDRPMNQTVVHSAVEWLLSSRRQGNHSSLTRAEVSGGGKKPWKQKGTGRARAGSTRSPLWRKGGVVFGPKPRDYSYSLPLKMRQLAIKVVLSDKVREGKMKVIDEFKLDKPKTKVAAQVMKALELSGKVLFIPEKNDSILYKAARNLAGVKLSKPLALNIFDLVDAEWIVAEKGAIKVIEGRFAHAA
jgi:large subunit ribosomal protein L4